MKAVINEAYFRSKTQGVREKRILVLPRKLVKTIGNPFPIEKRPKGLSTGIYEINPHSVAGEINRAMSRLIKRVESFS